METMTKSRFLYNYDILSGLSRLPEWPVRETINLEYDPTKWYSHDIDGEPLWPDYFERLDWNNYEHFKFHFARISPTPLTKPEFDHYLELFGQAGSLRVSPTLATGSAHNSCLDRSSA